MTTSLPFGLVFGLVVLSAQSLHVNEQLPIPSASQEKLLSIGLATFAHFGDQLVSQQNGQIHKTLKKK